MVVLRIYLQDDGHDGLIALNEHSFGGFDHGAVGTQPAAGEALDRLHPLTARFDAMAALFRCKM